MKRNEFGLLVTLVALTISGCTTTSKKKVKRHSSIPDSSESLVSSKTTTNPTSNNPTSKESTNEGTIEGTSSAPVSSASTPTSEASSSTVTTAQPPVSTSLQPSSSSSEQPSSVVPPSSSQQPPSSSAVPPSSSSEVPPSSSVTPPPSTSVTPPIEEGDYAETSVAYYNNDAKGLYDALHRIKSNKSPGSYVDLWELYKTAYIRDDGKIFDYYSCISNFRPGKDQAGNYSGEGDVYNREHSIPKSWYGHSTPQSGTQSVDPFIVVPTDGWVNSMRSNFTFGMVGSVSKHSAENFCLLGSGDSSWGYSGTVFEPDDSLKGDFARIVFYSIGRYNVSNWTIGDGSLNYSGSTNKNFGLTDYAIKLFSYWSNLDPVSEWERSVNDKVESWSNGYYGWRNPFIDHPEYANVLWGTNSNYTTYSH